MVIVSSGAIWWPNLQLMQVAPSGGQICNYANGAMMLPNLVQVTESLSGSVVLLAMFYLASLVLFLFKVVKWFKQFYNFDHLK